MFFTPLKYYTYKLLSSAIFKRRPKQYHSLISKETLGNLKQVLKDSQTVANRVVTYLSTEQLEICRNIHRVFNEYGKPALVRTTKSGGVVHDVVLYKRVINGLDSKIVYNFINKNIATVSYIIQVQNKTDEQQFDSFLKKNALHIQRPKFKPAKVLKGDKFVFNNEISLTFVNQNPEVIQNINAAVYIDKYTGSNHKYLDSSKFQLTF